MIRHESNYDEDNCRQTIDMEGLLNVGFDL